MWLLVVTCLKVYLSVIGVRTIFLKVSEFVTIEVLFVAKHFLFGAIIIFEGYCQLSCLSGSTFVDICGLIDLFPVFSRLAIMVLKLLCSKLSAITIAIVSQRSRFGVIAIQRRLQRYLTLAKIYITDLLYSFGLLILG